ncbi:MAG TPA: ABC transporter ATP-binding protein [Solimonas sp.]
MNPRTPQASALPSQPLRFSLHFARQFAGWYALVLFLQAAASASAIAVPWAIGSILRTVTSGATQGVVHALLVFIGLGLAEMICARGAGSAHMHIAPLVRARVTAELFGYIQHHSHRYFTDRFAGALAHRISETSVGVMQANNAILFTFLPVLVKVGTAAVLLGMANPMLALIVIGWATIFVSVAYLLARQCLPYMREHSAARSGTTGQIIDAVTNITNIRLFAQSGNERQRLDGVLSEELGKTRIAQRYVERIKWFQHAASLILKVGALATALWLWRSGAIDAGAFVMSAGIALLIIAEADNLGRQFLDFFEYVGNIENGVGTLIRPHEIVDSPGARPMRIERGEIEFRGVSFRYPQGAEIFRGLDLRIEPGQRVGLVGYSGSGKSTFVNLILRLFEPQEGSILIDGTDLREVTLESMHLQIGLIPQDPGLFHRTVADNIRYGRPGASQADVEAAAQRAEAHGFITALEGGYSAMVGERGIKLSGGQRQRIAIARVLLKDAPILILDEATSSLDSVTEQSIQRALDKAMHGKTVIVIAHRLSTVSHLDRILVFDGGRIVEDGSHEQLLALRGHYHRLWSRQADGFLPEDEDAA